MAMKEVRSALDTRGALLSGMCYASWVQSVKTFPYIFDTSAVR